MCTDRVHAPACKGETIRYVFTQREDAAEGYDQVAEKLVTGRFEVMSELDFVYLPAIATWSKTFDTGTVWWVRVDGTNAPRTRKARCYARSQPSARPPYTGSLAVIEVAASNLVAG